MRSRVRRDFPALLLEDLFAFAVELEGFLAAARRDLKLAEGVERAEAGAGLT